MPANPATPINVVGTQPIPNNSILKGIINNGYVTGITTTSWNARYGGLSKIVFKGTQDQLRLLAAMAKDGGYEYNLVGGHIWTLDITFPFDVILEGDTGKSNPLFTWELVNNPFEKDILELGDRPFNNNLSSDTVKAIENKLKNPENGQPPYTVIDANNGDAAINAMTAYNLKSIGVHGKQTSLQTIRKTMIVSNQFDPTTITNFTYPQYDYKVFTTVQWRQTYDSNSKDLNLVPLPMDSALPLNLTVSKWNIGSNPPTATLTSVAGWNMDQKGIVTYIGWLQFPPEYQMVSVNKIQITQHWTFNQWSAGPWGLYDPAVDTTPSPNPNDVLYIKTP